MDEDWLTATEAYDMIATAVPIGAAQAICARANDGLIEARATRLVIGSEMHDDARLPKEFWWARGQTSLKQNWASGDFETWIDRSVHWRAYAVRFRRSDIEAMLPSRQARRIFSKAESGSYALASLCVNELRASLDCTVEEAQGLILKGCRAGLVPSRCAELIIRVRNRYGEDNQTEHGVVIPDWFWDYCLDSRDTVLNWSASRFSGTGSTDGDHYRAVITGVEFEVRAIIEIETMERQTRRELQSSGEAASHQVASAPVGRRLSERWRPWVAELVAHVHAEGIPAGVGSQGQEELINAVAEALEVRGEESLSRSTVQPVVQAVLDRLREGAGN